MVWCCYNIKYDGRGEGIEVKQVRWNILIMKGFVFHIKGLELYLVGKVESLKGSKATNCIFNLNL